MPQAQGKPYIAFLVGTQLMYEDPILEQVQKDAEEISSALYESLLDRNLAVNVLFKGIMTSEEVICQAINTAQADPTCLGVMVWCHTFSPGLMWTKGLGSLRLPLVHFMTQFNETLPYETIDMDFMNLQQAAHGDLEWGNACKISQKDCEVVFGHWQDPEALDEIANWARAALGWWYSQSLKIAWYDGTMNNVSVTRKDERLFHNITGTNVITASTADAIKFLPILKDERVANLIAEYVDTYYTANCLSRQSLVEAARIEIAINEHLTHLGAEAFTYNFELMAFSQLPGLTAQRAMAKGMGFGPEGDYGVAWLVAVAKKMGEGLPGGCSLTEQYTYDLTPGHERMLFSHMLEICPSLAEGQPRMEVHPLGIGGKADPPRLVFKAKPGEGVIACLVQIENRLRLIVARIEIVESEPMPKLPVARILATFPNFKKDVKAWREAGGAHHEVLTTQLRVEHFKNIAKCFGMECIVIN